MAKNKKRKKGGSAPMPKLGPKSYIKKRARSLPIHACCISEEWEVGGLATIVISRSKSNGNKVVGIYLVDVFCLGLKNTFYKHNSDEYEYQEILEMAYGPYGGRYLPCEPTLAFNIIYGAIEYAEDLGFSPNRDFAISEYILDDVEAIEYMDIAFGKDGKPFYITGPNDNVQFVVNTLHMRLGDDGFDYLARV